MNFTYGYILFMHFAADWSS